MGFVFFFHTLNLEPDQPRPLSASVPYELWHEAYCFLLVTRTRNFAALFCQYIYYSRIINKVNVTFNLEQAMKAQRGSRGILYSCFNLGTRRRCVVNATPRPLYARERSGTNCIGGWFGSRAVWTGAENLTPPMGFDTQTVQPVASRYTNWTIPALSRIINIFMKCCFAMVCLLLVFSAFLCGISPGSTSDCGVWNGK